MPGKGRAFSLPQQRKTRKPETKPDSSGRKYTPLPLAQNLRNVALRGATKRTEFLHGQWVEVTVLAPAGPADCSGRVFPRTAEGCGRVERIRAR
jgi:hypothetical protein